MKGFRSLGFTAKLTILALPALVGLVGLVSWISYVNAANSELDRQMKLLVELRGDIMTAAVVGTQYVQAVENGISDTSQAKSQLLAGLAWTISSAAQSVADGFPETAADAREVLDQVQVLQGIRSHGQDAADEAGLLADLAQEAYKNTLAHTAALEQSKAALSRLSSPAAMITLVVVAIGLVALFIAVIARQISSPLVFAAKTMNDIAQGEGDLTRRLDIAGEDEIGQLALGFNRFTEKIELLVTKVKESMQSVGRTSTEIARSSSELSERTSEAAASLEETVSSLQEMAATVNQSAENARRANALAESARNRAQNGGAVAAKAITAMDEINASSSQIADIVGVIDGIAFQTNLLALNAAVEAARAGDQGRGFAVVAGEVRTLAQRSSDAAKEIRQLIADSVEKVRTGSSLVNESGEALNAIVGSIQQVSDIVSEIAAATNEHATGIQQINKAVGQMDDMTQQNAALVEELAAATESLSEETESLQGLLGGFKVKEPASRAHKFAPEAPPLRADTKRLA